jgi:gas vesicle protein GvpA/GvpJ/GvpM family
VTKPRRDAARALLEDADASLLELVDNVLTKGVVIHGEIVLGLVNLDLGPLGRLS